MKRFHPLLNRLLVWLQQHEVPGKHFVYRHGVRRYGHYLIEHELGGLPFYVPWDQWCFWLNYGPQNYYLEEMEPFFKQVCVSGLPTTFVDLGADIGTVSRLASTYCSNIEQYIALEPNPTAFAILQENYAPLGRRALANKAAISDFIGLADFEWNSALASDHEGHLAINPTGSTPVVTLDHLFQTSTLTMTPQLALKIDVEGQEANVFKGARESLNSAEQVVCLVELHPTTVERDGVTPEAIFTAAETIRPFEWRVPLRGNQPVNRRRAFYEQFEYRQYDVIGVSL